MSLDDLLITMIIPGIGLSGAYLRAEDPAAARWVEFAGELTLSTPSTQPQNALQRTCGKNRNYRCQRFTAEKWPRQGRTFRNARQNLRSAGLPTWRSS
jgi:hypothetical protein